MAKTWTVCKNCNKDFYYYPYGNKHSKFCCLDCYYEYLGRNQRFLKNEIRICDTCKKEFTPKTKTQTYCGKSCASRARHNQWKNNKEEKLKPFQQKRMKWDRDPWEEIKIYDAYNVIIKNARYPDFILGF